MGSLSEDMAWKHLIQTNALRALRFLGSRAFFLSSQLVLFNRIIMRAIQLSSSVNFFLNEKKWGQLFLIYFI